jgi:hypothetical protein
MIRLRQSANRLSVRAEFGSRDGNHRITDEIAVIKPPEAASEGENPG